MPPIPQRGGFFASYPPQIAGQVKSLDFAFWALYNETTKENGGADLKITIHEDPSITETEIMIKCAQMTDELRDMIAGMGLVGHTFAGERQANENEK